MAHNFKARLLNFFYQGLTNAAHVDAQFRWNCPPKKRGEGGELVRDRQYPVVLHSKSPSYCLEACSSTTRQ